MTGWNPLASDITESSVWHLPDQIRLAWVAIVAKKDHKTHLIRMNPWKLSQWAKIPEAMAAEAIRIFESPDPNSTSQAEEGRRIMEVEDGVYWVVTGGDYAAKAASEQEKLSAAARAKKYRDKKKPPAATTAIPEPAVEPIPPELDSPAFRKAWADFKTMRARKRKPVTAVAAERLLKQCLGWGSVKAIRSLDNSIANDWQGLFDPDKDRDGNAVKLEDDPRFVPGTTIPYFDNGKPADPDPFKDVREAILGPGAPLSAPSP